MFVDNIDCTVPITFCTIIRRKVPPVGALIKVAYFNLNYTGMSGSAHPVEIGINVGNCSVACIVRLLRRSTCCSQH